MLPFEVLVAVVEKVPLRRWRRLAFTSSQLADTVLYLLESDSFWRRRCEEHGFPLLPCQLSPDWRTAFLDNLQVEARPLITKTDAKREYRLTDTELEQVSYEERRNPHYRSATPMRLYQKRVLFLHYSPLIQERLQKVRQRRDKTGQHRRQRQQELQQAGITEEDTVWAVDHLYLNLLLLSKSLKWLLQQYHSRKARYDALQQQLAVGGWLPLLQKYPHDFHDMLEQHICGFTDSRCIVERCKRLQCGRPGICPVCSRMASPSCSHNRCGGCCQDRRCPRHGSWW